MTICFEYCRRIWFYYSVFMCKNWWIGVQWVVTIQIKHCSLNYHRKKINPHLQLLELKTHCQPSLFKQGRKIETPFVPRRKGVRAFEGDQPTRKLSWLYRILMILKNIALYSVPNRMPSFRNLDGRGCLPSVLPCMFYCRTLPHCNLSFEAIQR